MYGKANHSLDTCMACRRPCGYAVQSSRNCHNIPQIFRLRPSNQHDVQLRWRALRNSNGRGIFALLGRAFALVVVSVTGLRLCALERVAGAGDHMAHA